MYNIDNMSREELIELINKKEEQIEVLEETLSDLYQVAFTPNSIDTKDIHSPESFSFSNLVISTDEEDNESEVEYAEKAFDKNKEKINELHSDMVSERKEKLSAAVDNYLSLLKKGVNVELYALTDLANLDFENYSHSATVLCKLVGYTPNKSLEFNWGLKFCLSIFSNASKLKAAQDNESVKQSIQTFIEYFLHDSTTYKDAFTKNLLNYTEKVELLEKNYAFNADFLNSAIALKEKKYLNKNLETKEKNILDTAQKSRL